MAPQMLAVGRCDYTNPDAPAANSVKLFSLDTETLKVEEVADLPTPPNPSWVTSAGDLLLATSELAKGASVSSLRRPGGPGQDGVLSTVEMPGGAPCHIAAHPSTDGQHQRVFVANYLGSTVRVTVAADGSLDASAAETFVPQGVPPQSEAFHDRQEAPHPHHVLLLQEAPGFAIEELPAVVVSDLGNDNIVFYSQGGKPKLVVNVGEGTGPRRVALHNNVLYSMNELDNSISAFRLDGSVVQERCRIVPKEKSLRRHHRGGSELAVAPNGLFLVAATRSTNEVVTFRIQDDGTLVECARGPAGGTTPRHIVFATPQLLLLACHRSKAELHPEPQETDCIALMTFNEETGSLKLHSRVPCEFASCVALC